MCAAETYTILIVFGYPYIYIYIYLTKNPINRLAFLSGAKRVFFYIYTTIPIPNPKDPGKTGDIII